MFICWVAGRGDKFYIAIQVSICKTDGYSRVYAGGVLNSRQIREQGFVLVVFSSKSFVFIYYFEVYFRHLKKIKVLFCQLTVDEERTLLVLSLFLNFCDQERKESQFRSVCCQIRCKTKVFVLLANVVCKSELFIEIF